VGSQKYIGGGAKGTARTAGTAVQKESANQWEKDQRLNKDSEFCKGVKASLHNTRIDR